MDSKEHKQEDHKEEAEDHVDENYNPEEEIFDGNWKVIDLPKVDSLKPEDVAETLWECKMKLYRWDVDQWKERAIGQFSFIKDKSSSKVRGILRQEVTNKIMANFYCSSLV